MCAKLAGAMQVIFGQPRRRPAARERGGWGCAKRARAMQVISPATAIVLAEGCKSCHRVPGLPAGASLAKSGYPPDPPDPHDTLAPVQSRPATSPGNAVVFPCSRHGLPGSVKGDRRSSRPTWEEHAMKARRFALLGLAVLVALVPHALFALAYFGGDSVPRLVRPAQDRLVVAQNDFIQQANPFGVPVQEKECTLEELRDLRGPVVPVGEYTIRGPHTHGNLSVYFIHGPDKLHGQRVMTLQSALAQNQAVVREGAVTMDNHGAVPVFIQAGDIIKGGNQDRTLQIGRAHV